MRLAQLAVLNPLKLAAQLPRVRKQFGILAQQSEVGFGRRQDSSEGVVEGMGMSE
jgi:hypothetical protein